MSSCDCMLTIDEDPTTLPPSNPNEGLPRKISESCSLTTLLMSWNTTCKVKLKSKVNFSPKLFLWVLKTFHTKDRLWLVHNDLQKAKNNIWWKMKRVFFLKNNFTFSFFSPNFLRESFGSQQTPLEPSQLPDTLP